MTRASTAGAIVTDSSRAVNLSLEQAQASFRRHLRAANKAPRTIQTYLDALDHFGRYLSAARLPLDVGLIDPEHVEAWLVKLQDDGRRAASVANRYRRCIGEGWTAAPTMSRGLRPRRDIHRPGDGPYRRHRRPYP